MRRQKRHANEADHIAAATPNERVKNWWALSDESRDLTRFLFLENVAFSIRETIGFSPGSVKVNWPQIREAAHLKT